MMNLLRILIFLLSTPYIFLVFGQQNIVQVAKSLGATKLLQYATTAGLADTLSKGGPFTVFAPTNEAFNALPTPIKEILATNRTILKEVLLFHVVSGTTYSSGLKNEMLVESMDSGKDKIRINIYNNGAEITADGCAVIKADRNASNGVIHVIDKVLYPIADKNMAQYISISPELSTLAYALIQGKLINTLTAMGPYTLFAPDDTAFDNLPPGTLNKLLQNQTALVDVLTYHLVENATDYSKGLSDGLVKTAEGKSVTVKVTAGGVTINNAKVIMADEAVSNGVVHVIDQVLLPPQV